MTTRRSSKSGREEKPPRLTKKAIEEALRRGAKSAQELHEKLERWHLEGYSRAMSLRLD